MIYSCRKTINANGRYMYYVHPISHMGRGTPHSPESSVKDSGTIGGPAGGGRRLSRIANDITVT